MTFLWYLFSAPELLIHIINFNVILTFSLYVQSYLFIQVLELLPAFGMNLFSIRTRYTHSPSTVLPSSP
jgi:hypothetical protein